MRRILLASVVLLVVVGVGVWTYMTFREGGQLTKTQCPHTPTTFTVPLVVTPSPNSTITWPSAYPEACPGDTVEWTMHNKCKDCGNGMVKIRIDDRHRRNDSSCADADTNVPDKEPFAPKYFVVKCKPEHAGVPYDPTGTAAPVRIDDCKVKSSAHNGCYKYSLKGTFDIDPEVEVQGGLGILDATPPTPSPAASPRP
jgi:hypothetical protein